MAKFIGIQRIHRAILNLKAWREKVKSQGAMHLWPFLVIKRKNITTTQMQRFGESNDKVFFDDFMRVQNTDHPYYDPLEADMRISTHSHSNVSTSRKKTFANTWRAAEFENREETEGGRRKKVEYWRLQPDYLEILREHLLTKGKVTTKVPLFDLLVWLYRKYEFPDDVTLDQLVQLFRDDFHITDAEFSSLFTNEASDGVLENAHKFFVDRPVPDELVLTAVTQQENFDLSEALSSVYVSRKAEPVELDDILTLVQNGRGQLIIQGPPGTGKTFVARQVTALLLGAERGILDDPTQLSEFMARRQFSSFEEQEDMETIIHKNGGVWDIIQFHPSYNYEDFVRGITSTIFAGKDFPSFQVENRIFGLMAELSMKTQKPLILIIDEINRGDISKVLGELIYALEYRGEGVRTPYVVNCFL